MKGAGILKKAGFVTLLVRSYDEAMAFYTEKAGFALREGKLRGTGKPPFNFSGKASIDGLNGKTSSSISPFSVFGGIPRF
jgi:hypothetical protein